MITGLDHPAVVGYLRRLEIAAADLPPERRTELLAEIRGHLMDALGAGPGAETGELEVLQVLERLGSPEEIVAAERPEPPGYSEPPAGGQPSPWSPLEIWAVLALTVGMVVLIGPVVGLVLMWMSRRWTRREKKIATVLTALPLAVLAIAPMFLFAAGSAEVQRSRVQVSACPAVSPTAGVAPAPAASCTGAPVSTAMPTAPSGATP